MLGATHALGENSFQRNTGLWKCLMMPIVVDIYNLKSCEDLWKLNNSIKWQPYVTSL